MTVELKPLGPDEAGHGTFAVNVDGVDSGARVVNGARDWTVHRAGVGVAGWTEVSRVVAWLESDAGQKWLSGSVPVQGSPSTGPGGFVGVRTQREAGNGHGGEA